MELLHATADSIRDFFDGKSKSARPRERLPLALKQWTDRLQARLPPCDGKTWDPSEAVETDGRGEWI